MNRHPFILFVALLMLEFCVAFSSISNFGILARQRTMFLPMIFMLLSTPPVVEASAEGSPRKPRPLLRSPLRPSIASSETTRGA